VSANYRLYGLTLRSSIALPALCESRSEPDVRLRVGSPAQFARAHVKFDGFDGTRSWYLHRLLADGTRYLRWSSSFEFLISSHGRQILYRRLNGATSESLGAYLLGHVLSFSLVALGFEPLHGTVVVVDGRAVGFLGDCGYGKSTLAAALLGRGASVLTDDLMVLGPRKGGWVVHPGMPRLKLFPSVARKLLGHKADGPRMNPGTSKLILSLRADQAVQQPVQLEALYVLSPGRSGSTRVGIEPLSMGDSFLEIVRAAFNLIVTDRQRLSAQFALAERLTASVRVRRLTYPRGFSALPAVCDAVLADLRRQRKGTDRVTRRPVAAAIANAD